MENVSEKIYSDGGQLGTVDGDFIARNVKKAIAAGLPCCAHCGKGVDIKTSWSARHHDVFWALSTLTDDEANEELQNIVSYELVEGFKWILLGTTCGPKVIDAAYRVKTSTLNSKIEHDDFNRRFFGGEQ